MCKFNMFITAVCVLFLIKLRWPKNKSIYDFWEYFSTWERTQVFIGICGIRRIVMQIYTSINLGHGFKKANAFNIEMEMIFCSAAP